MKRDPKYTVRIIMVLLFPLFFLVAVLQATIDAAVSFFDSITLAFEYMVDNYASVFKEDSPKIDPEAEDFWNAS